MRIIKEENENLEDRYNELADKIRTMKQKGITSKNRDKYLKLAKEWQGIKEKLNKIYRRRNKK